MLTRSAAVAVALLAAPALAEPTPACQREADGAVRCDADGFARLTRATLEARARADVCAVDLTRTRQQLDDRQRDLDLCESVPPCDPTPEPSRLVPLLGLAAGVVGALAIGASTAWMAHAGAVQPAPAVVAAAGLGVAAFGAVLVAW